MSAYAHLRPLRNPENDAKLISKSLANLGFSVTEVLNGKRADLIASLQELVGRIQASGKNSAVVVYLAGHGIQVDGLNYFLPVDAHIERKEDVRASAVDVESMMVGLKNTDSEVIHFFLDACSNEPFRQPIEIGQGRGLAAIDVRAISSGRSDRHYNTVEVPVSFALGLAAQPGNFALDGDGQNSPYALALARAMETEGLDSEDVLLETRNLVARLTSNEQVPWSNTSLRKAFYFKPLPQ